MRCQLVYDYLKRSFESLRLFHTGSISENITFVIQRLLLLRQLEVTWCLIRPASCQTSHRGWFAKRPFTPAGARYGVHCARALRLYYNSLQCLLFFLFFSLVYITLYFTSCTVDVFLYIITHCTAYNPCLQGIHVNRTLEKAMPCDLVHQFFSRRACTSFCAFWCVLFVYFILMWMDNWSISASISSISVHSVRSDSWQAATVTSWDL